MTDLFRKRKEENERKRGKEEKKAGKKIQYFRLFVNSFERKRGGRDRRKKREKKNKLHTKELDWALSGSTDSISISQFELV